MIEFLHLFESAAAPFPLSAVTGVEEPAPAGPPVPIVEAVAGLRPMGNATFTFTSGYNGITGINVVTPFATVALTNIVETGANEATADCPYELMALINTTVQVEVTDANGTSDPFDVVLAAPDGMAQVIPTSVAAGSAAANIPGFSLGNQIVYENPTTEDGYPVTWALNGELSLPPGTPVGSYTVSYYVIDHTDGTSSLSIGVATVVVPPNDDVVDSFTVDVEPGLELNATDIEFNPITPTGYDKDLDIPISVAAGLEYRVSLDGGNNWGAYTAAPTSFQHVTGVPDAPQVQFKMLIGPATFSSSKTLLAVVGGVNVNVTAQTRAANAPIISLHPVDASASAGEEATFTVEGSNISTVEWRVNGVVQAGQTGTTLAVTQTVAGAYTISGTAYSAEGGSAQLNQATLTVTGTQPAFTSSTTIAANNWSVGTYQAVVTPSEATVELVSPVAGVTFNPANKQASLSFATAGTYQFTLRATYNGLSTEQVFDVVVDGRPIFYNDTVFPLTAGTINPIVVEANDPEGGVITFTPVQIPNGLAFTQDPGTSDTGNGTVYTGRLTGVLAGGAYTATIRATAANGGGSTDITLTLNVANTANSVPVIYSSNLVSVTQNQTVNRSLSATDADGDSLVWALSSPYDWVTLNGNTLTVDPDLTVDAAVYQVVVSVTDGQATVNQTIFITVSEAATNPEVIGTTITAPDWRTVIVPRVAIGAPQIFTQNVEDLLAYAMDFSVWFTRVLNVNVSAPGLIISNYNIDGAVVQISLQGGVKNTPYLVEIEAISEGGEEKTWAFYLMVTDF